MLRKLVRVLEGQRWRYAARSVRGLLRPDLRTCPTCGASRGALVKRKLLVTALRRCEHCQLLYRTPRDPPMHGASFYQSTYESGLTTHVPDPAELERLLATGFKDSEKDFRKRIAVLEALGIPEGASILDFGASWGYATWQLNAAGWRATGYELSEPRARFARESLAVDVQSDWDDVGGPFDVFFSSHVLEHLPDPSEALRLAKRLLRPGGLFIAFTPNGADESRATDPDGYHRNWGRLHGVYLDERYYAHLLGKAPMLLASAPYGGSYDLPPLQGWARTRTRRGDLGERELLFAAPLGDAVRD